MLYIKRSVWLKCVGVAQILEDLECKSKKFELDLVGNKVVQRHFDQKSDIAKGFLKRRFSWMIWSLKRLRTVRPIRKLLQ